MKCWTWGLKLLKPIFNDLYLDKMKFIENPLRVQCTFSFLSSATFVPTFFKSCTSELYSES